MILADTSAWVEYDRATGSSVDRRLTELIASDGPLATTEPVIMALLAGSRENAEQERLRRMLLCFELLSFEVVADFEGAAHIYRRCRAAGVTPRGLLDCMIAAVASRREAALLSRDADLSRVADVIGIALDHASITA